MIAKLKEIWNKIGIQFVKFGFVGVSNTVVSLLTYYIVVFCGGHYLFANTLGFILGTLNAYWWNSHFVFKRETVQNNNSNMVPLFKSFISYGASFVLSSVLLYLQVQILNVSEVIAPIVNVMITTPLNFVMNKLWIFTDRKD